MITSDGNPETGESRPRCGHSGRATTHQPSLPARSDPPMQLCATYTFSFYPGEPPLGQPIETWFSITARRSIRRGTFTSVKALIKQIRRLHHTLEQQRQTILWTAAAGEILAKVCLVEINI